MTRGGRLYGDDVTAAIDAAYERGFEAGVKWVIPGIRVKLTAVMRDMEKAMKRTKAKSDQFTRSDREKKP